MNQKLFELIYVMIVRQELKPQDAYDMLRDFFRLTEISEREKASELKPEVHKWEPIDLSKLPLGKIIDNPQPYTGTWSGDIVYSKDSSASVANASTAPTLSCTCYAANSANSANTVTTASVSSDDSSIEANLASESGPFADETAKCKSSSGSSFQTVPATETAPIY